MRATLGLVPYALSGGAGARIISFAGLRLDKLRMSGLRWSGVDWSGVE